MSESANLRCATVETRPYRSQNKNRHRGTKGSTPKNLQGHRGQGSQVNAREWRRGRALRRKANIQGIK